MRRVLLVLGLMVVAAGCAPSETKQESNQATPEATEETTTLRETTEATVAPEFSVGKSPMEEAPEEKDERDVDTRRPPKAASKVTPPSAPPVQEKAQPEPQVVVEEEVPSEPVQSPAECRFFTQSEFVNATPEQKAFIQECDRAAGRAVAPPSAPPQDYTSKGYPTPQGNPEDEAKTNALTPAGKALKGEDVNCPDFASPAEAQSYLLPGDPYGLDRDNDGVACE